MDAKVDIYGLRLLPQFLANMPRALGRAAIESMLIRRAQPVVAEARQRAPHDTGQLANSITASTKLSGRQAALHRAASPEDVEVFIGAGPLARAHIHEYGSAALPARPYMRPAWDNNKMAILEGIRADLWRTIVGARNNAAG